MLRDLLDALRCPRDHEESWLVAMVHRAHGAMLLDADLACPVCGAEFSINDGVARFDPRSASPCDETVDGTRVAALLGVTEGLLPVLLAGRPAMAGAALAALVPVPQVWLNAPANAPSPPPSCSAVDARIRLPFGVETLAGAAVDTEHTSRHMLESIVRAVRVGGRIVAPVGTPLPAGVKELARDHAEWVAEVTTRASGLVELRRREPDQVG